MKMYQPRILLDNTDPEGGLVAIHPDDYEEQYFPTLDEAVRVGKAYCMDFDEDEGDLVIMEREFGDPRYLTLGGEEL